MLFLKTISVGITPTAVQKSLAFTTIKKALTQAQQTEFELDEEGIRRFQICPPKTIKGIRKIPLTAKAMHALKKQKEYIAPAVKCR